MRYEIRRHGFQAFQLELLGMNSSSKVVVITGCSSGFGEGAAKAFADKGYRVWGTLRDAEGGMQPRKQRWRRTPTRFRSSTWM